MKMKQISNNSFINNGSYFPKVRLRRLRKNKAIRDLLQETRISSNDLIYPIFVEEGLKNPKNIPSMPDIQRIPLSKIVDVVSDILNLGIKGIVIFGIPSKKDNNSSINILAKIAESHAASGSDIVAPSAMMDGQVFAIRERLDEAGFNDTSIMGYSAKMASPMYSPFRDLADSSPLFGDRKTYQMPFTNSLEALREIELDVNEGADMIMVKPALPYLDLICKAREIFKLPLCAYSVSGEYALIKAAAEKGWVNESQVMLEFLSSIKRAGADIIITYHAREMAKLLLEK